MKQKILAALMLLTLLASQTAFAAETVEVHNTKAVYGWSILDSGFEIDTETQQVNDRVDLVDDDTHSRVVVVEKKSGTVQNKWKGIFQTIPAEKLTVGHTYIVEYTIKANAVTTNSYRSGFDWPTGPGNTNTFTNFNGSQNTVWKTQTNKCLYDGSRDLTVIFYNIAGASKFWLASAKVYDQADSSKTDLLVNGDFAIDYTKVENVQFDGKKVTWILPEPMVGDGVNIYQRDLEGNRVKLNTSVIPPDNQMAAVQPTVSGSFYIDVVTCLNGMEISVDHTASELILIDDVDIIKCKWYKDGKETNKISAGTMTVALPVRNNRVTGGCDVEIIVLLKKGHVTHKIAKEKYKIMPSDEINEYTVDIEVEAALVEGTQLSVYVWDGIDSMNVLRDVQVR